MKRSAVTISLIILSFWWIFTIIWQPGVVHFVARLVYPDTAAALVARERAIQYSQLGGNDRTDIFFTPNEISHLDDVSRLYKPLSLFLNIASVFAWAVLLYVVHLRQNSRPSLRTASSVLVVIVTFGLLSLLLFSNFFIGFHEVLFPAGNWQFPANSFLITIFPETFWKLELLLIVLLLSSFSLLYKLLSLYGTDRKK